MTSDLVVDMENALQAISRTSLPSRFKPTYHELRELLEEAVKEIEELRSEVFLLNEEVEELRFISIDQEGV